MISLEHILITHLDEAVCILQNKVLRVVAELQTNRHAQLTFVEIME